LRRLFQNAEVEQQASTGNVEGAKSNGALVPHFSIHAVIYTLAKLARFSSGNIQRLANCGCIREHAC
jgi:hypothetical protein